MKRLRFIWIDDKKNKVESFRAVIEAGIPGYRASLELIQVEGDILSDLSTWAVANRTHPPHLIVIDHVFTPALPFALKGSSVAHLLRSLYPTTPMVCVTAMLDRPQSFDQEDISEYTALFPYQHLERHIEALYAIASDFPKLRSARANVRAHLVEVLRAPKRDKADLLRVLPEEFHSERHATTEHRMARWIYNTFLRRPGFLYDRLHAATLLGLNVDGFDKVEPLFSKARYRGVFATSEAPRWWVSELREQLYALTPNVAADLPQDAGRMLNGIASADYSVCYVTRKAVPPPDAVVYADATRDAKLRVVRRDLTAPHPNDTAVMPGFESRLILKKASK